MNSDTTGRQQLTINNSWDGMPRWSRDGSRICYASDISAYQHWEIYIMNNDGSNITRVTNTSSDATAISPVWMPIDSSTSINEDDLLSKTFQLYQNYPNPFNPITSIKFELKYAGDVTGIIFNESGQEIIELFSGYRGGGTHIVHWDGNNANGLKVSSGTYFYRLTVDGISRTKKMLLLK